MRSQPLVLGSFLLLLSASVGAQIVAATPVAARPSVVVPDVVGSDEVLGAQVQAETGETLGSVEDVLVDSSGRLLAFAIKPAPALRADGQLTALPAETLLPASSSDAISPQRVLHVRREAAAQLRDAPGFARERWNEALTPEFVARMREHFAVKAGDAPAAERLSTLLGSDVVDSEEANVGRVNALAVDLGRRELAAAIVTPVEDLGSRDRLLPVPFSALRPAQARAESARSPSAAGLPPRRAMAVGMKLERLRSAPRFDRGDMQRLRSLLGASDMRSFYAESASRSAAPAQRGASQPQRPAGQRPAGQSAGGSKPAGAGRDGARPSTPKSNSGAARGSGSPRAR